ncbi:MAG: hypothetical protein NT026_00100 [Candidatus Staskawiczbacteria bacterium]|nr:hypothetical protein [Candidatus Staskawiczbacteria bacterium]
MKKEIWLIIILALIIVGLGAFLLFGPHTTPTLRGGNGGIEISFVSGDSSPMTIKGYVTGKNGWAGFEGQVGTVKLLDASGKELANGVLTATTEWTTLPTNFETTLNFSSAKAQSGTLVFHNENASGLPEKDKTFTLPVKIK